MWRGQTWQTLFYCRVDNAKNCWKKRCCAGGGWRHVMHRRNRIVHGIVHGVVHGIVHGIVHGVAHGAVHQLVSRELAAYWGFNKWSWVWQEYRAHPTAETNSRLLSSPDLPRLRNHLFGILKFCRDNVEEVRMSHDQLWADKHQRYRRLSYLFCLNNTLHDPSCKYSL